MQLFKLILALLLLLQAASANAYWQYPVTNYQQKEYASGTQNWQIAQQQNGWMYFANNHGLLEFDGYSWDTHGLWNSSTTRSVAIAPDGTIYVGGSNEFGKFQITSTGLLVYTPLSSSLPENERTFGEVWNILILSDRVLFQTQHSIYILKDDLLESVATHHRITSSAQVGESVFIATTNDLFLLTGKNLIALKGASIIAPGEICSMTALGEDKLLIATSFSGVFVFNGQQVRPFPTDADSFLRSKQLFSIATSQNHIALGTVLEGLVVCNLEGTDCQYVNQSNGLQNNTIISLKFDRNENLWLGLDNGIDFIEINSPIRYLYGQTNFKASGYSSIIDQNNIYLGTNQGLFHSSYPFDSTQRLNTLSLIPNTQGQVWNIRRLNQLIYLCHNRGLFEIRNKQAHLLFEHDGVWDVKLLSATEALLCTYNSLYIGQITPSGITRIHSIGKIERASSQYEIDPKGRILCITEKGLERITITPSRTAFTTEIILPSHEPKDYFDISHIGAHIAINSAWMFARIDSLGEPQLDPQYAQRNLLGLRLYYDIQTDADSNLWMASNNSLTFREYLPLAHNYDTLARTLFDQPYFYIGGFVHINPIGNKQAIVGNVQGFALVDASKNNITTPPHPIIRSLTITIPRDSVIYGAYSRHTDSLYHIDIPYKRNSIRLLFGKTENLNSGGQFSYQLLPDEKKWSLWTEQTTKEYTNLQEGSYTFKLRLNHNGEIRETALSFRVAPPWYRTLWMQFIYVILTLLTISYVYRRIRHRYEEGKKRIEQRKNEEILIQEKHFRQEVSSRENEILLLKSQQLEYELRGKSQELSHMILSQLNINEILAEIKSDLKKIQNEMNDKNLEHANRKLLLLQHKLSRSIEYSIDWTKFEENFDIVNDNFLKHLYERFPWLNKNERKLCVYIKMGLLNKEIAPLMNLSTRGVEMLRYRMRKKMDLERSDDLQGFFQLLCKDDAAPNAQPAAPSE